MATKNLYPRIILKKGKEAPIERFHPWIFSGAIREKEGNYKEGDLVEVFSDKYKYLATGYYQKDSIAVKLLTYEQQLIDKEFWITHIKKGYELRRAIGLTEAPETNIYRLINSEGDGIPGLIIDNYNNHFVVQAHSQGIFKNRNFIAEAIQEIYGESVKSIYSKSKDTLKSDEADTDGFLYGNTTETIGTENSHKFKINWQTGQKTGFFIDQRENRQLLSNYIKNKTVLNAYAYSGGFSIYALKAGATSVDSVDVSKPAIELLNENVSLNNCSGSHTSYAEDVHQFLRSPEKKYDVIVLDPPAFAKHFDARHKAVLGYKNINKMAIANINKGGILFTFSCSNVVDKQLFNNTIMASAIEAGRKVKVLHQLSQAPDHPVSIFHPEGGYLKGLVVYVE